MSSSRSVRFLTAMQIKRLHLQSVGNLEPSQPSLLESAASSPMNVKHYTKQDNIFQLAANLSEKLMKNHAFMDGNKRTALVAADMFLKINGHKLQSQPVRPDPNNEGLTNAHVAVTTGGWDAEALGRYYEQIATPLDEWMDEIKHYHDDAVGY